MKKIEHPDMSGGLAKVSDIMSNMEHIKYVLYASDFLLVHKKYLVCQTVVLELLFMKM